MKFYKLSLSVIVIMTLLMSLVGCAPKQQTGKTVDKTAASSSNSKKSQNKTNKNESKKTTISFALQVANVQKDETSTYEIAQAFMKKHPNIVVKFEGSSKDEHVKKMKMAAQANQLPDIFWMPTNDAKELFQNGNTLNLSDFVKSNKTILPNQKAAFNMNGKEFGLPYQVLVTGFWYNKAILDKYNLKVPQTFDEFKHVVTVLHKNHVVTIAQGAKSPFSVWAFLEMICRYGFYNHIDKILAHKEKWNNPDFSKFYQKVKELGALGAFPDNMSTMNYDQAKQMFLSGKAAMFDSGVWDAGPISKSKIAKNVGFWWGPTFSDGVGNQKLSMISPSNPIVVSAAVKKDKNKYNAVMEFLKFFYSKEAADIMIKNQKLPLIKYDGKIKSGNPQLSAVIAQMGAPGWKSAPDQPNHVMPDKVTNALYDSILGVASNNYTVKQAMQVVQRAIK